MNLELYLKDIADLKELIEELPEDATAPLMKKIELLARCYQLLGEVSGECDRQYEVAHVIRDLEYAKAKTDPATPKPKIDHAELIVADLKFIEAEYYGRMHKYRNEYKSTEARMNALKLKMRVNFADGSIGSRYGGA